MKKHLWLSIAGRQSYCESCGINATEFNIAGLCPPWSSITIEPQATPPDDVRYVQSMQDGEAFELRKTRDQKVYRLTVEGEARGQVEFSERVAVQLHKYLGKMLGYKE